jgi:hypothetical protein
MEEIEATACVPTGEIAERVFKHARERAECNR